MLRPKGLQLLWGTCKKRILARLQKLRVNLCLLDRVAPIASYSFSRSSGVTCSHLRLIFSFQSVLYLSWNFFRLALGTKHTHKPLPQSIPQHLFVPCIRIVTFCKGCLQFASNTEFTVNYLENTWQWPPLSAPLWHQIQQVLQQSWI